jgi:hypothetical protein
MDLESTLLYLAIKHLGAVEIHAEINKILGEGIVGDSTITQYLQKQIVPNSSQVVEKKPEIGNSDQIDRALRQALNGQPFGSLPQLAKRILIAMTTIRYHLVNKMQDKIKHRK